MNCHNFALREPIHCAARIGIKSMVEVLIERHADPNARTIDYRTPLIEATSGSEENQKESDVAEAISYLLEKGANPNLADLIGRTPLHWAAFNGYFKIAKILIEGGANIRLVDKEYVQPIHLASFVGKADIVTLLLEKGADPNALYKYQRAPIHYAVRGQSPDVLRVLSACKANVDLADEDGTTPSMLAEGPHQNEMLEIIQKNSDQGRTKVKINPMSNNSLTKM